MRDGSDERLQLARKRSGYASAAEFLKTRPRKEASTYYGYENGSRPISIENAKKYGGLFRVRWQWLYEDEGPPAATSTPTQGSIVVPRLSWVAAGRLSRQDTIMNVDIEEHVEAAGLPKGDWVCLTVRGNSMDRIAPDGATIFVNRADDAPRAEAFYVFRDKDTGDATFKRYRAGTPPKMQPFSTDPNEETLRISPTMTVFGRVRRVMIDI